MCMTDWARRILRAFMRDGGGTTPHGKIRALDVIVISKKFGRAETCLIVTLVLLTHLIVEVSALGQADVNCFRWGSLKVSPKQRRNGRGEQPVTVLCSHDH